MRTHGEPNMPEPDFNGGHVSINIGPAGSGVDPNSPQFAAANKACEHLVPTKGGASGGNTITPADQADYLKAVACMRSHGIPNFPDPSFENNSVEFNDDDAHRHELSPVQERIGDLPEADPGRVCPTAAPAVREQRMTTPAHSVRPLVRQHRAARARQRPPASTTTPASLLGLAVVLVAGGVAVGVSDPFAKSPPARTGVRRQRRPDLAGDGDPWGPVLGDPGGRHLGLRRQLQRGQPGSGHGHRSAGDRPGGLPRPGALRGERSARRPAVRLDPGLPQPVRRSRRPQT